MCPPTRDGWNGCSVCPPQSALSARHSLLCLPATVCSVCPPRSALSARHGLLCLPATVCSVCTPRSALSAHHCLLCLPATVCSVYPPQSALSARHSLLGLPATVCSVCPPQFVFRWYYLFILFPSQLVHNSSLARIKSKRTSERHMINYVIRQFNEHVTDSTEKVVADECIEISDSKKQICSHSKTYMVY